MIINDHSTNNTAIQLEPFLDDFRVHCFRLKINAGLGAALNFGLERAQAPLIAYLPFDDVVYLEHLQTLIDLLEQNPEAVMATSAVRHPYRPTAPVQIPGYPHQLVQVANRASPTRRIERKDLVTDDLERKFFKKLRAQGRVVKTHTIACEWIDRPHQSHKLLQEPEGGINRYRQYFEIQEPLRFHTPTGNLIDEMRHYRQFRERPNTPPAADGLKILLVGELAYPSKRVLALEERGHRLYGLWMRNPYGYNSVDPLPFGHVRDLPFHDWKHAVHKLKSDGMYALLNWQAVPFVHAALNELPDVPFIWHFHFKEGLFICLEIGTWPQRLDVYTKSDGQIYISPEMKAWIDTVLSGISQRHPTLVLDPDLPKRDGCLSTPSSLLSKQAGEFHTVVPAPFHRLVTSRWNGAGRKRHSPPFLWNFTQNQGLEWIDKTRRLVRVKDKRYYYEK